MNPAVPLALAMLLYFWSSFGYFREQRIGLTIAFIGYSIGNIGLIIDYFEMK
jgi:hypothetical protein